MVGFRDFELVEQRVDGLVKSIKACLERRNRSQTQNKSSEFEDEEEANMVILEPLKIFIEPSRWLFSAQASALLIGDPQNERKLSFGPNFKKLLSTEKTHFARSRDHTESLMGLLGHQN